MFCPKCGEELNNNKCVKCGYEKNQAPQKIVETTKKEPESFLKNKNNVFKLLITMCIILVVVGFGFFVAGFDKKDNYYKSENKYVGGDAYNFIINSNYFTGNIIIGSACCICSSILFCTALKINISDDEQ